MLVGVLTTAVIGGAALVEKAKIQKVIEDIDYYEKAFVNFTLQFGQLPGNLRVERCREYIETFEVCKVASTANFNIGDTVYHYDNSRSVDYITLTPFPFMQLQKAGFIKGKVIKSLELGLQKLPNGLNPNDKLDKMKYRTSWDFLNWYGGKLDFDKEGRVIIDGSFDLKAYVNRDSQIRGTMNVDGYKGGENIRDNRFMSKIAMLLVRNQPKNLDGTYGIGKGASGLLSADVAKKIDRKIDDGFPKKGKLQGMKIGNGIDKIDNRVVCYNGLWDEKETATKIISYVEDKNAKRGCNLIYYLPDYSGYIF